MIHPTDNKNTNKNGAKTKDDTEVKKKNSHNQNNTSSDSSIPKSDIQNDSKPLNSKPDFEGAQDAQAQNNFDEKPARTSIETNTNQM